MTIICSQCGTRNSSDTTTCRRCATPIVEDGLQPITRKGSPNTSVLGERWVIDGPLHGVSAPYLFLGHDIDTGETVVIKRLPEHIARDRAIRSQFFHEAKILSQLNHANLARVIDVIESQTQPAMVMTYFEGETLEHMMARHGRFPVGVALEFANQILDGLHDLHEQGILHRNLAPSCIQVHVPDNATTPVLVLSDFGVAQVMGGADTEGTLIGMRASDMLSAVEPTQYASPEVLTLDAQKASDLYALGVILYQMLTGQKLLPETSNRFELVQHINETKPLPLDEHLPSTSDTLVTLVASLLEKNPQDRPQDAATLMSQLRQVPERTTARMLYIPAGVFLQGSKAQDEFARKEEMPQRLVEMSSYFMDQTPVTCAQFGAFLDATNYKVPKDWYLYNHIKKFPQMPVVYVNWFDAQSYAQWVGKSLPTEAQWEKAARGTSGHTYPWGDEVPSNELAWFDEKARPHVVGQFPRGASIYNVRDMAGNVFEWVSDWYDKAYYNNTQINYDPDGPKNGRKKVLKGGSFVHPAFALRCAVRGRYVPDERRANHSFRCAWKM